MVPPRDVSRQAVCVHMHPETLEAVGDEQLGVRFTVDSLAPFVMRLYWGVPVAACNALLRQNGGTQSSEAGNGRSTSRRVAPAEAVARWPAALAPLLPQGPGPSATAASASSIASSSAAEGLMSGSLVEIAERPIASTSIGGGSGSATGTPTGNRELFAAGDCKLRSSPVAMPASLGQRCETPADGRVEHSRLGLDLTGAGLNITGPGATAQREGGVMPLVIALTVRRSGNNDGQVSLLELSTAQAHTQVSFVRFKRSEANNSAIVPEVLQQVVFGDDGTAHRVLGVFGFEEENGEEVDCMICYDRPRSVLLLPCRHCSVCSSCLRSLRDERCPLCRAVFSAYLLFPLPAA